METKRRFGGRAGDRLRDARPRGAVRPPGRQRAVDARPNERPVPILMYHVIADPPASAPFPDLYVSRADLRAQVRWLERAGYEAVTLGRVFDAWNGRATLPAAADRPLVRRRIPEPRHRGAPDPRRSTLAGRAEPRPLEPRAVVGDRREPASGGSSPPTGRSMPTRSRTPTSRSLSGAALAREVSGSRQEIHRRFGVLPRFFCYPAGRYDAEAIAAVRRPASRERRRRSSGSPRPRGTIHAGAGAHRPRRRRRGPGAEARLARVAGQRRYRDRSASVSTLPVACRRDSRERAQLLEPAAELAHVAADGAVLLARDDRPRVRLERSGRQRRRRAVEVHQRPAVRHAPDARRDRPGRDDPATVRAEACVLDGGRLGFFESTDISPARDVPDDDVVVACLPSPAAIRPG